MTAIRYVEEWGGRLRRFSLHVHLGRSLAGVMRENLRGGGTTARAMRDGTAFVADFERALWVLSQRRRVLVVGVALLELGIARAGGIAGMTPGEAYREYEKACVAVFEVMERGGYVA